MGLAGVDIVLGAKCVACTAMRARDRIELTEVAQSTCRVKTYR